MVHVSAVKAIQCVSGVSKESAMGRVEGVEGGAAATVTG